MRFVTKTQGAFLLPLDIAISSVLWYPCWLKGDDENAKKQSDTVWILYAERRDNRRSYRVKSGSKNF